VALSFVLVPTAHLGLVYTVSAFVLGAGFIGQTVRLWQDPSPGRAMKVFGFSITYLTVVFLAMGVDAVVHPW
jgi:protoheme IX farnesyltransferase